MTDETTDTMVEEKEQAAVEPAPVAEAPVPFWQRPRVERYLLPLITPIIVVVGLVVYVLNLSRVFLSAHGHTAVAVGTVVTVTILVGATVLSNSKRLRSSSIALTTTIFVLAICVSGWLVLGHSQVKGGGTTPLPATGAVDGSFTITAAPGGVLTFAPLTLTEKTGIYAITLVDGSTGPHTLNFDNPAALWPGVQVSSGGDKVTSRIYFGTAGDYTFFCNIPGHRAAGMSGVIHVTGPTLTVAQAEAAGK
jgi:plastocyanin